MSPFFPRARSRFPAHKYDKHNKAMLQQNRSDSSTDWNSQMEWTTSENERREYITTHAEVQTITASFPSSPRASSAARRHAYG